MRIKSEAAVVGVLSAPDSAGGLTVGAPGSISGGLLKAADCIGRVLVGGLNRCSDCGVEDEDLSAWLVNDVPKEVLTLAAGRGGRHSVRDGGADSS